MEVLEIVKMRNGITSDSRDNFINTLIKATRQQLKDLEGIVLEEGNVSHDLFLADYVSWQYDNQGDDRMPQHIRFIKNELWNSATSKKEDENGI